MAPLQAEGVVEELSTLAQALEEPEVLLGRAMKAVQGLVGLLSRQIPLNRFEIDQMSGLLSLLLRE